MSEQKPESQPQQDAPCRPQELSELMARRGAVFTYVYELEAALTQARDAMTHIVASDDVWEMLEIARAALAATQPVATQPVKDAGT